MRWDRWYTIKSYVRSALWTIPLIALVLEQITVRLVSTVDVDLPWVPQVATTVTGATGVMDTVTTLAVSFMVFTFGSMLVAIQVAGGQMTPRIIATALLRDNPIRFTVGLFMITMLFSTGMSARTGTEIPHLALLIVTFLGVASVAAFLFLIDYTARLLRPVTIVWLIAEQGLEVIEAVYPDVIKAPHRPISAHELPERESRVIVHQGSSAVVLAVNLRMLVREAQRADGIVELVHRVGDFVSVGEPLFRLYGNAATIDDRKLRAQVAFGRERTIEQDALFAFRVIVDIAVKALSKAINDPTTAVLAIDQIHRLLRSVGRRHLHDDSVFDANGNLRLIFPTPDWEDFVQLSFAEIRLYGAENFQVARRLRAMILNLIAGLPEARWPALQREMELLDRSLELSYRIPEDLEFAKQPDLQGLGGTSSRRS